MHAPKNRNSPGTLLEPFAVGLQSWANEYERTHYYQYSWWWDDHTPLRHTPLSACFFLCCAAAGSQGSTGISDGSGSQYLTSGKRVVTWRSSGYMLAISDRITCSFWNVVSPIMDHTPFSNFTNWRGDYQITHKPYSILQVYGIWWLWVNPTFSQWIPRHHAFRCWPTRGCHAFR